MDLALISSLRYFKINCIFIIVSIETDIVLKRFCTCLGICACVSGISVTTGNQILIYLKWKKCCVHSSGFGLIFFILAGKEDMHKCLDVFELRPDPAADYGPQASEKNRIII